MQQLSLSPYISKPERIFFSLGIFLYFVFFGILSVALYFQLPNQILSATTALSILAISLLLFTNALAYNKFYNFDTLLKLLGIYILYFIVLQLFFRESSSTVISYNPLGFGYQIAFKIYGFFAYSLAPFLLLLMPQSRLDFLARNPFIILIPTCIAAVLFLFLWGDSISSDYAYFLLQETGVSRHLAKMQYLTIFSVSVGLFIFSKKIIYNITAIFGMALASYAFMISLSQSNIVSAFFVMFVATIFSFRRLNSFIRALILNIFAVFFTFSFLIYTKTFDRIVTSFFGMSEQIYLGAGGDESSASRIDLILVGLKNFAESPIIGGTPWLEGGVYTHFFIVDVLMGMGIFGIIILCIYFATIIRVYIYSYKNLDDSKIWILLLATCFFSQQFFHGSILSIVSFQTAIFISIDMIRIHNERKYINAR